ncbi:MAG: hypothetical protein F9K25_10765 [Candidatus Contendobacter sp.]|nr:MAG: hypothetical protein F9K25_10765 [Candidatus Contendobacter sp.]
MKPTDALPHPADWSTATISKTVEIKRGISWSKEQEHLAPREGAIPVIRIGNVQERLELDDLIYISGLKPKAIEKKRVAAGWAIIVGSNGNRQRIGNAVKIVDDTDFLFASFLIAAKPKPDSGITPEFFYRWLSSEQVQAYLSASSEGSTGLSNLSHSFFKAMAIPYPTTDEQAAIARILDAVDTTIEQTREVIDFATKFKNTLVQDFFYSALGLTAYADRPSKELPSDWVLLPMEALIAGEPKNGVSPKASSQPPGTPTFSIAAIRDGRIDLFNGENLKYTEISPKVAEKFKISKGDILIVRGNANPDLVGKAGRITDFPDGCIYPDITKRVVLRNYGDHRLLPEFTVLTWNHAIVHNQVLRRAKTSNGTLKINNRDVKQILLPVPPLVQQEEIVDLIEAVDTKIDALTAKFTALEQVKKSLMHDLLTGKVRVGDNFPELIKVKSHASHRI